MADSLDDLASGSPLCGISAGHIRGWNHAGRRERERGDPSTFGTAKSRENSTIVRVKNMTGEDLSQYAVTVLGPPVIGATENLNEFKQNWIFEVNAPGSPSANEVIAVLLDPLEDGKFGRATIQGATPVQVEVTEATDGFEYAEVSAGETNNLVMAEAGPARVVGKDPLELEEDEESAVVWALVCLMGGSSSSAGAGLCGWDAADGYDPEETVNPVMTVDQETGCVLLEYPGECEGGVDGGTP
jgi:hypothetical protein